MRAVAFIRTTCSLRTSSLQRGCPVENDGDWRRCALAKITRDEEPLAVCGHGVARTLVGQLEQRRGHTDVERRPRSHRDGHERAISGQIEQLATITPPSGLASACGRYLQPRRRV